MRRIGGDDMNECNFVRIMLTILNVNKLFLDIISPYVLSFCNENMFQLMNIFPGYH